MNSRPSHPFQTNDPTLPSLGHRVAPFVVAFGFVFFVWSWPTPRIAADETVPDLAFKATYKALEGRKEFAYAFKDAGVISHPVGMLNWEVPNTQFSTGGLERYFRTYSCEPLVSLSPGTYPFKFESITLPTFFGLANDDAGQAESQRRTKYIKELYGRYYQEALKEPADLPSAFQAALWEVVQESAAPAEGTTEFSLFSGDFRANYREAAASPEYVRKAEEYLHSLTGDDKIFDENPAFSNLELVRMTGVPGPDGSAPQAQIALRLREGATQVGASGLGDGGLAAGGPLLGGGSDSGSPVGRTLVPSNSTSAGGGAGGGGGGYPGIVPPGGGSGGGSSVPGATVTGGSGGTGGGSGGGTTPIGGSGGGSGGSGGDTGSGGGPSTTNPVPAPPALLLAGLGIAAAWLGRKALATRNA